MNRMILAALSLALLGAPLTAQEKAEPNATRKNPTPVKVQVVFGRYAGEKKTSSLPYTLSFGAPGRPARLRMGIEVPVSVGKGTGTLQYKNVGANLDCSAEPLEDGRYKLELTVEQSSIYTNEGDKTSPDAPLFRSFNASFTEFLRDGQSASHVLAADPLSGETLKLDVTLTVLK
jgi:Flp pilus assembly secretin CpaC